MTKQKTFLLVLAAFVTTCHSLPQFPSINVNSGAGEHNDDTNADRREDLAVPHLTSLGVGPAVLATAPTVPCKTHGQPVQESPINPFLKPISPQAPLAAEIAPKQGMFFNPWQLNRRQPPNYLTENFRTQPSYDSPIRNVIPDQYNYRQPGQYPIQPDPLQRRHIPDIQHRLRYQLPIGYPITNQDSSVPYDDFNMGRHELGYPVPGDYQEANNIPIPGYLVPGYQSPYQYDQQRQPSYLVHYPSDPTQPGSVLIYDEDDLVEEGRPVGGGHNSITKFCRLVGGHQLGKICRKITRPVLG